MDNLQQKKLKGNDKSTWFLDNLVTIIFVVFIVFGFMLSKGVSMTYFFTELSSRIFRNSFLVLSLIIPVIAGLGLNFGIVIGAMAGQIAMAIVRYYDLGGLFGLFLCFVIALPFATLFGYFTGKLYNKTRGQEMIASLIVGFFANGIYYFIFLFAVGKIIKIPANHPMVMPETGVGVRMSVDLGNIKYGLDNILKIPFMWAILLISLVIGVLVLYKYMKAKKDASLEYNNRMFILNMTAIVIMIVISLYAIITKSALMLVAKTPVVTGLFIVGLCIFTELIMKTKLGQDFRSVGQSQHIAEISGINVDRTRIIATIMSTVLAAWGQIIFLQNMGTLNTYNAHTQIGMFSVACLLVGGASTSNANIKHAIIGTILFNSMFIMSPEVGKSVFGNAILGEYFRTFMVYGVIGLALGIYVWKANKQAKITIE